MVDVLLIYPSVKTSDIESSVKIPPLGLAYIAAVLEKEGYSVQILDENVDSNIVIPPNNQPKIIGISALTPFHSRVLKLAERYKNKHGTQVIVGGAHATALPEELLKSPDIDYVIKGEGEQVIVPLVKSIMEASEYGYKPHGIIVQAKDYIQDLDTLPYPARHLLDLDKYKTPYIKGKVTSILTSRGCPFQCTFCDYRFLMGNKFRRRSPTNVVNEIEYCIKEYGVTHFSFRDSTFTFDEDWITNFCIVIHERKMNMKFSWDCNGRVNLVTENMLEMMKWVGCNLISYGIESGCQRILDIVEKHTTPQMAIDAVKLTQKIGIETTGYYILGLPTENWGSIKQTVDLAKKLNCDYTQFSLATPFPGTPLYDYAKEKNLIREGVTWDDFSPIGKSIMRTEELDFTDLEKALKDAYRSYYLRPRYIAKRLFNLKPSNLKQNWNGLKTLLRQQNG